MGKKEKKAPSSKKKSLPSFIEEVAKVLRSQVKTKQPKPQPLPKQTMSNTIEQIALILRQKAKATQRRSTKKTAVTSKTKIRRSIKDKKKIC